VPSSPTTGAAQQYTVYERPSGSWISSSSVSTPVCRAAARCSGSSSGGSAFLAQHTVAARPGAG
jgi:hypothetical protein